MDIFIENVPPNANHTELRLFLRDVLVRFDILAFEIFKKVGKKWAIITTADAKKALKFLQNHGGSVPLNPLTFRNIQLRCRRSNKIEPPDLLQVKVLLEKESTMRKMRAKRSNKGSVAIVSQPSRPIFPFITFQTGVWEYDNLGKLIFDSKFKDERQGTVTFGKSSLVIYLAASIHTEYHWHCRIDIPYSIIENTIPSIANGKLGTITLTLKTPPKIYRILSKDDLHLYSGVEPTTNERDTLSQALGMLSLGPAPKRMLRECAIIRKYDKNSALCMVYRVTLPDITSAQSAWAFVSQSSALSQAQCWKTVFPTRPAQNIEMEYRQMENLNLWEPQHPRFSFAVRFQLLALVLEGTVPPAAMSGLIPHVKDLCRLFKPDLVARGVRKMQHQIPTPSPDLDARDFSLARLINTLQKNVQDIQALDTTTQDLSKKQNQHSHLVSTYKATITPTGLVLRGPDLTVSNRVLRKYSNGSEFFLRVFFADEDGQSVLHDPRAEQDQVYSRFRKVLQEGIVIAGQKYNFLGFSHSSLHYHTAWFMAPFFHNGRFIFAKNVIEDLGDFSHIHCSAKCAARIGQAFSDTLFAVHIPRNVYVIENNPDVKRNGRCFSDGCGTISLELLEQVWRSLPPERRKLRPTILQIRYRGAKGVISLDTRLPGKQLLIRKSMTKYNATESWRDLEICGAAYKPLVMYLNHQFIKILEDLGVPHQNFLDVQNDAFKMLEMIISHPLNAASFLEYSRSGVAAKVPGLFTLMHEIGINFQADRFLTDIVEVAAMSSLRDLKYRARIPVEKGYLLYGIMDETNVLKEGEVYIAIGTRDEGGNWRRQILTGDRVVVTRAPALHPGDVQVARAVDVPLNSPLRDLYNCIVFSQQGARDLPSQLGGGDLDGDLFHIICDQRLIPPRTVPASDYPSTPAKDLGRPVQVEDIVEFFIEYMNSDRLGQISNKHKIRADLQQMGTMHEDCITLAKLASDAVDFSKSGKAVDMTQVPKGADRNRPDFMASAPGLVINDAGGADLEEEDNIDDIDDPDSVSVLDPEKFALRYYRSSKILGILYRRINEANFFSRMKQHFEIYRNAWGGESLIQKLERYVDRETCHFQWEHYRDFAEELREYYEENMLEIMDSMRPHRGKPLTELEVFSGNILGKKERASTRYIREANLEVQERFNRDVSSIVRRIVSGDGLHDEEEEALPRAIACFKVALKTKGWEGYAKLKSWKYVAAAVCLEQLSRYMGFKQLRPL